MLLHLLFVRPNNRVIYIFRNNYFARGGTNMRPSSTSILIHAVRCASARPQHNTLAQLCTQQHFELKNLTSAPPSLSWALSLRFPLNEVRSSLWSLSKETHSCLTATRGLKSATANDVSPFDLGVVLEQATVLSLVGYGEGLYGIALVMCLCGLRWICANPAHACSHMHLYMSLHMQACARARKHTHTHTHTHLHTHI